MHGSSNVVASVADAIATQSPAAAMRFTRGFKEGSSDEKDQIRELNRYWRLELASVPGSTISARTCLIDNIDPRDWLRHFRQLVLPVIIQSNLPRG